MPIRRGADYIRALRDGREVWHAGKRILDVTAHSGFSGTIKTWLTCTTSSISPSIATS